MDIRGIATPDFFFDELNKYGAQYIDPIDVLDFSKIDKFKIIINPYGEDYFLVDSKDLERPTFHTIKNFIEMGGIWVHAGGYPFWKVIILKTGKQSSTGPKIAESFGLTINMGPHGIITTTNSGYNIIGNQTWRCDSSRSLQNSDEIYAVAETEKGKMNILSSSTFGKGKIIHYGGMHTVHEREQSRSAAKIVCKLIKYISIKLI